MLEKNFFYLPSMDSMLSSSQMSDLASKGAHQAEGTKLGKKEWTAGTLVGALVKPVHSSILIVEVK